MNVFAAPLLEKKILRPLDLWDTDFGDFKLKQQILTQFLICCTVNIGPNYIRNTWKKYNMKWSDYMPEDKVESYIRKHVKH